MRGEKTKGRGSGYFILPRPEYDCFVVELPPMPEASVPTALRYQARSRYPGDPAATLIDSVANGPDRLSRLVLAMRRERLEFFTAQAAGRTLLAPTLLLYALASGGSRGGATDECTGLFCAADWVELARFRGRTLVWSASVRREEGIEKAIGTLGSDSGGFGGQRLFCVLSDECAAEAAGLASELSTIAGREPEIIALSSLVKGGAKKAARPFVDRARGKARSVFLLRAALAAAALSALVSIQIYAGRLEGAKERAKRDFAAARALGASALATKARLDQLEAQYAALEKAAQPEPYAFIADIVDKLGPRGRVRSLRLEGRLFQLEAEDTDALALLARFDADARYTSVKLHEAVPGSSGGERLSISGEFAQ